MDASKDSAMSGSSSRGGDGLLGEAASCSGDAIGAAGSMSRIALNRANLLKPYF